MALALAAHGVACSPGARREPGEGRAPQSSAEFCSRVALDPLAASQELLEALKRCISLRLREGNRVQQVRLDERSLTGGGDSPDPHLRRELHVEGARRRDQGEVVLGAAPLASTIQHLEIHGEGGR